MPTPSPTTPSGKFEIGIEDMRIKNEDSEGDDGNDTREAEDVKMEAKGKSITGSPVKGERESSTESPKNRSSSSHSPSMAKDEHEETLGGEITVKMEPGQPPKLARSSTQKVVARSAPLFDHLPDKTVEATSHFEVMSACTYSTKYLGYTEHAMECDCAEEWDIATKANHACGEDSDCINRATKMECFGDCGCGANCQNQRFQQRQYANVSVIETEKKGYGLRADADLMPNDFIFEYLGEVIHEGQFRKRMRQYDEEGIKHFYFMSLTKGEFVDATKKGNLGRFCNHSCNPNCFVDKWVVGDKLRMGIFAERKIKAGEELVFNYNVDRYGADPQPCYCGEPNCTGFIGGKTQTERATKLSNATIEALGIDDGDGWDTAVAKKPRKKKTGEDDEEYVNNVQPRSLEEDSVTKVMATLMQCKEKWIAVKLLGRIQRSDDERVISRVVKMHGYQILSSVLGTWKEDFNVVLQVLDILNHFPRLTKNKISDSKIEATVSSLKGCGDDRVETQADALLQEWSSLETAYRIPRKKRDHNAATETTTNHYDRRGEERKRRSRTRSPTRSRSSSFDAPKGPSAPTGPRSNMPQRYHGPRPPFRPPRPNFMSLPQGWFAAVDNGRTYYYSAAGQTTWTKPTQPAAQPPPPPKPTSANKALDDIINEITSAKPKAAEKKSATATPKQGGEKEKTEKPGKKESWRNLPEEKQRRLYENTLFPHIKHVVDKYRHKIPKDDLKKFGKEIAKKIVNSDYKNKRVDDPTRISEKQEKQVKKFVKEFLDKAAAKSRMRQPSKSDKDTMADVKEDAKTDAKEIAQTTSFGNNKIVGKGVDDGEATVKMKDDEDMKDGFKSATPITPADQIQNGEGLKRKRHDDANEEGVGLGEGGTPSKRPRSITPPTPQDVKDDIKSASFITPVDWMQGGEGLKRKREDEVDENNANLEGVSPSKRVRSVTPPTPQDVKDGSQLASPIALVDRVQSDEGLKRKRDDEVKNEHGCELEEGATPSKRVRSATPPTPPPPPPPPADAMLEEQGLVDESEVSESESSPQFVGGDVLGQNPPPPPPPPLTPSMDEQSQNQESFNQNGIMPLSFDPETTPGRALDSIPDEQEGGLGGMHPSRSHYLEASGG